MPFQFKTLSILPHAFTLQDVLDPATYNIVNTCQSSNLLQETRDDRGALLSRAAATT